VLAIRCLNPTWMRAAIDGIIAVQFLLAAAQNIDEETAYGLGQSEDSLSYLSSRRSLSHEGTHKEGFYRPHLASDHHGGDAFRPRLTAEHEKSQKVIQTLQTVALFRDSWRG
jgi:hypothetical protein